MATRVELMRRKIISETPDKCCPICGNEDETVPHLFLGCEYAYNIWYEIFRWLGIQTAPHCVPEKHLE
ncbi:hypothetical protein ACS0TY_015779 [Phlomoides rotata]